MHFSEISGTAPAHTSMPTTSVTSNEFFAALTDWLTEARCAIKHDPRTANQYWAQFEALLLRNGSFAGIDNQAEVPLSGLAPWQRARIATYVEANLTERLSTVQLAALVRLSTSHFCRAFKADLGCSPHQYVIRRRIVRSKTLMLETEVSLAQIALECGLADQAHLSRLFRRRVGMSPSAWRRRQELRRVDAPAFDRSLVGAI
jgi:AraC family transcriptional regulator